MPLTKDANLTDMDAVYAEIVAAHRGLGAEESARLNARLVLILANHIGDEAVLREAIRLARRVSRPGSQGS
jgi:hypothetical protein